MAFHQSREGARRARLGGLDQRLIQAVRAHRSRKVVAKIAAIRLPAATQVMMIATSRNDQSTPGMSAYSEANQKPIATAPVTSALRHAQ